MTAALRIISTDYARGAVIKLATDHKSAPIAKFIVQKRRERFELKRATSAGLEYVDDFATQQAATGYAIRECERMQTALAGGSDAVRCPR